MFLATLAAWSYSVLALVQTSGAPQAPVEDAHPFGYPLVLPGGENLLSYAWDGHASVPFLADDREVLIPFGERGLGAYARLYLPGHSPLEAGASGAQLSTWQGIGRVDGRYDDALGFTPSSFGRIALPPQGVTSGWTLSFWLRPESGALGRTLVLLPGALELALTNDGHVRARLMPSGPEVVHPDRLVIGAWSALAVAYDPVETLQTRLAVNGVTVPIRFSAPEPPRLASELQIGDLGHNGRGFAGGVDELVLEGLALSTAELEAIARNSPAPGSHALHLVTNRGLRTVAPAAHATRELVLDAPGELELGELEGTAVANGELRWVPARWTRLEPAGSPPPRTCNPFANLGGGHLLTFGGETRDTHLWPGVNSDDTWLYDPTRNTWEEVATPVAPAPRCHTPMAYSPDDDLVLMVGGWRNDVQPNLNYDDTWVFHVRERRWEQRFPGGDRMSVGASYGLVYLPSQRRFLLIRPHQNALYDPVANTWQSLQPPREVDEAGNPVSYGPWISPICALDPSTGLVTLFGGVNGTLFSDQTALYDPVANQTTVLRTATQPSPRVRSGFAYDPLGKRFVLFGGVQDQFSQRHDDLWVFDPAQRSWTEVACSNRPSERGGYYGMGYDERADRFLLFGGRHSPDRWLDETWALEWGRGRPGTALYTFDRLENRGRKAWFADVVTPGRASVRFLFRASESGAKWTPWGANVAKFGTERFVQALAFLTPGSPGEIPAIRRLGLR
jgi:hypothetical protein